jgi:uncharacterized protein
MILLTVNAGEELIDSVKQQVAQREITSGAIVSLVGAVDSCEISMPDKDGTDVTHEYSQPFELTGTGEIINGKVHVHAVLGCDGESPLVGHLHRARVERLHVHVYVVPLAP